MLFYSMNLVMAFGGRKEKVISLFLNLSQLFLFYFHFTNT